MDKTDFVVRLSGGSPRKYDDSSDFTVDHDMDFRQTYRRTGDIAPVKLVPVRLPYNPAAIEVIYKTAELNLRCMTPPNYFHMIALQEKSARIREIAKQIQ